MLRQKLMICALLALLLAAALPSRADTVPSAVYTVALNGPYVVNNSPLPGPVTLTQSDSAGNTTAVKLSYSDGEASASTAGTSTGSGESGLGILSFFFEVVGSKSEPVPIVITGNGTASLSVSGVAESIFETPFGSFEACSAGAGSSCNGLPESFSSTATGNATPGTIYSVSLLAEGGVGPFGGSWSASVDPQVQIDSSFADANDFTLEFSPNPPGTGGAEVPEPTSASLLLFGCLLLAMMYPFRFVKKATLGS